MIELLIGTLIIFYCIVGLIDINKFINKFHGAELAPTIDSYMFIFIFLFFIYELFTMSGPIALLFFLNILLKSNSKSQRKKRFMYSIFLISIIIITSLIIVNSIYLKINLWTTII
jgi:hypothetical protein